MWNPIYEPCDYILLQGQESPGICELVDPSSPRNWDVQKGLGLSGAFCLFTGRDLSKFSALFHLYELKDWINWYAWAPIALKMPKRRFMGEGSRKKGDSGALDIWHPLLEQLGIKAVVVENVIAPKQTGDGVWTAEIKFLEFRQPRFGLAKPEGAEATPVDPVDQTIDDLSSQLQAERLALQDNE
jgi:hypothetical protein